MQPALEKELRRITERELHNYRKNGAILRAKAAGKEEARRLRREELASLSARELARMRCWQRVIARVVAAAKADEPMMYRFMRAYFALVTPRSARLSATARNLAVMEELSLSDSLLYDMRRRAVSNVLLAAVEAGLFKPYGLHRDNRL